MTHTEVLNRVYDKALQETARLDYSTTLPKETHEQIRLLVSRAETNKGLITVLITLLTHKIVSPSQDIRYHQTQLPNGFSGRTIDTNHITPFMQSVHFPAMSESGWLTRSLEQPLPYTLDYERIGNIHGCQVIVNGVYSSIKYYLRLLKDPAEFIEKYVALLKADETVKFQHKEIWNTIVNKGA